MGNGRGKGKATIGTKDKGTAKDEAWIAEKWILNNVPVYLAQTPTELTEGLKYISTSQGGFNSSNKVIKGLKIGTAGPSKAKKAGNVPKVVDDGEASVEGGNGEEGGNDFGEGDSNVNAADDNGSISGDGVRDPDPAANVQPQLQEHDPAWELIIGRTVMTFLADERSTDGTFQSRLEMAQDALANRTPIGIVVEKGHVSLRAYMDGFTSRNERYALMGAYVMVDCWVENRGKSASGKPRLWLLARLYKTNRNGMWWEAPNDRIMEQPPASSNHGKCGKCGKPCKIRYKGMAAFCCRPGCPTHKQPVHHQANAGEWNPDYISASKDVDDPDLSKFQLLPDEPRQFTRNMLQDNLLPRRKKDDGSSERDSAPEDKRLSSKPAWNSYVCNGCNRLNRRIHWDRLQCRCCNKVIDLHLPDMSFDELVDPQWLDPRGTQALIDQCWWQYAVVNAPEAVDLGATGFGALYLGICFNLYDDNSVYLLVPRKQRVDDRSHDSPRAWFDSLWRLAQEGKLALQRRRMKRSVVEGQLTAQFNKNYGEPYNTSLETDDTPFDDEPPLLQRIMGEVQRVVAGAIGEGIEFNEHLPLGNYTNQHMGWHSDGEDDIKGNAIASVSLGGSALMSFGLHPSYSHGHHSKQEYAPMVPGTKEEKAKMDFYKARGTLQDDKFWDVYEKILKKCHKHRMTDTKPILQFPIPGTGGIVIQKGKTLNTIYSHTVEATGLARLVITGRVLMTKEEKMERDKAKDQKKKDDAKRKRDAKKRGPAAGGSVSKKRFVPEVQIYDPVLPEDDEESKGKGKGKATCSKAKDDDDNNDDDDDYEAPKKAAKRKRKGAAEPAAPPKKKRKDDDDDDQPGAGTGASTATTASKTTRKQASLPVRTKSQQAPKTTAAAATDGGGNTRPRRQRKDPGFYAMQW